MKLKGWFGFDSTFDLRTLAFSMHLESGSGVKKDKLSLAAKKFHKINPKECFSRIFGKTWSNNPLR